MPDVLTEVRKRRGPFTRVVIALVVAWWVLGLIRMVLAVVGGLHPLEAAARHGQGLVSVPVVLVLLLFAVADVWVRPRLENAARLTSLATWVSSLAVGTSIAAGIAGLWSPALKTADRALAVADIIVSSVVPVLLCVALGTVAGAARRAGAADGPRTEPDGAGAVIDTGTGGTGTAGSGVPGAAEEVPAESGETVDAGQVREPDAAAGAAWHSAADAAHGQQAAAWGDTTTPFGWEPARALDSGAPVGPGDVGSASSGGPVPKGGTLPPGPAEPPMPGTKDRPGRGPGQIDPDLWDGPHSDPQ
ncbi:hypothetical protein [Raineyella sp.]|uniref:hypothetical protein n=1 Tax=Raineyella sp. TaxID=1911550 RepID=UPI002B209095|nr:hypothetical protein [Raineyella sp.]MEA5153784.1 hypothetical protein [Raineyella sp.]